MEISVQINFHQSHVRYIEVKWWSSLVWQKPDIILHKGGGKEILEKSVQISHPSYPWLVLLMLMSLIKLSNCSELLSSVIQAALLHDTVEDTDTTFEELEAVFGNKVARIVREVTDDKTLPKQERKLQQVNHAPHCSHQAKLVKLADKLYNLRDLNRCTPVGVLCSAV